MTNRFLFEKLAICGATAISTLLSACGGGSSNNASATGTPQASTPSQTATSANVATPQYAAGSAQIAAFQLLNRYRQQCGFAELTENRTLDQAAQAHATYMDDNGGTITDTEVAGNQGYTAVTYADRAVAAGYPSTAFAGGASGGFYTNATLTQTQYGQQIMYGLMTGVYHVAIAVWPVSEIGIGFAQEAYNGFPEVQASFQIGNLQPSTGTGPLTFPCQGTTGLPYSIGGEIPSPPNTSGNFGTPIAVAGLNIGDTIVLTSGTIIPADGSAITLDLLDSTNDPNQVLPQYEAVAYPTLPLLPNTAYTVSITGTDNRIAFSRNFTFTTGSIVG